MTSEEPAELSGIDFHQMPMLDLVALHDESAEGLHPLPQAVMDRICEVIREGIHFCGCDMTDLMIRLLGG
ncbi:hypothetical protein [Planotetraspora phitsanulokensis]|uniref:Uncharacterized protein n=1 Tax=Planotetraspora phitsanulokensis TaxID=575192 RepID=A0A8J3UB95_9ACTN|nr:hypothetical protein [Planotetraspora phitsanulokensis]GII42219.1 hypothetical protein Pph01_72220 [Planotetraspora phitsanulokensis]